MARMVCQACKAENAENAARCVSCGTELGDSANPPIKFIGGKLQAVGTLFLACAIIATVTGAWWGPALLFPGVVVFLLGKFF